MFQQCAPEWVDERTKSKNNFGKFDTLQRECSRMEPPSSSDEICRRFHEKIKEIK